MSSMQLTTRDIPTSPALETHIRKKAEKLRRYCKKMISCRIVIEQSQKHRHQGKVYSVHIDLAVPGKELAVTRKHDEDIYIAIREAFNAAGRQLEEHSRKRHGRVKTHPDISHGYVTRIIPEEGFGFIAGDDGNEYYFSMTNVSHPSFSKLMIGDAVGYIAELFKEGQHAHHVVREKRNHRVLA